MSIFDRWFRKGKIPLAERAPEEIAEALTKATTEAESARDRLEELHTNRAGVLLDGTDADLQEHDEKLDEAQRTMDRLTAAVARLEGLLEQAKSHQADHALHAMVEEGAEILTRYAKKLDRYGKLTEELVQVLNELEADDTRAGELRRQLRGTAYEGHVQEPNSQLRPLNEPVHKTAVVPPVAEDGARYHPTNRTEVAYRVPERTYDGPVHDLGPKPAMVLNADGDPVLMNQRRGRGPRGVGNQQSTGRH